MKKPKWRDAPYWAQYLAMDDSGDWFWYELQPKRSGTHWDASGGRMELGRKSWDETLEERPAVIDRG